MENLTITEAAAALNTTPTAILMLLRRNELTGVEVDGTWRITSESLQCIRAARQGDGPLVECRSSCASKAGGCASCGTAAE
ncbi:MAG: helix-turn-helix domain-containing protein [Desulfuromonadales bacterium]|nr:helix-turn-helix domain-containing protein [Desulfuromonadales bacterium]